MIRDPKMHAVRQRDWANGVYDPSRGVGFSSVAACGKRSFLTGCLLRPGESQAAITCNGCVNALAKEPA